MKTAKPKNLKQLLNQLCNQVESFRQGLNGIEIDLDTIRLQLGMAPHFSDEDADDSDEDTDEVEDDGYYITCHLKSGPGYAAERDGELILYFRDGPVKTQGWRKWWTGRRTEAKVFDDDKEAIEWMGANKIKQPNQYMKPSVEFIES